MNLGRRAEVPRVESCGVGVVVLEDWQRCEVRGVRRGSG